MAIQLPLEATPGFPDLPLRDNVCLWATWAASYLAGDTNCDWGLWVRAHYQGWKAPEADGGQTLATWHMDHTALLRRLASAARARGEQIWTERQNKFHLAVHPGVMLAGQIDLVTVAPDGTITVTDAKTGQRKPSHVAQVMVYQWVLTQPGGRFPGRPVSGCVAYADGGPPVLIPPEAVSQKFESQLLEAVTQFSSGTPPYRTPSPTECRYCPLAIGICPERVNCVAL
jgi:RecB family exonuclease